MTKRIALISDHASPLAVIGGVDSGGQNVYVAHVARQLAALGHQVDVFTRRDHDTLPTVVQWYEGVRVIHVPAGPAEFVRKEALLPYMPEFARWMTEFCRMQGGYDLTHANFFMSGMVALELKQALGIPFVITFHALGHVRRQHQREADQFPAERLQIEETLVAEADAIVAECPQDKLDLETLYGADPAKLYIVPCGFDKDEFWPVSRKFARHTLGFSADERLLVNIGRLVPRKGIDNAIRGLGYLKRDHGIDATLLVVGGNSDVPDPQLTPEIERLGRIAAEEGAGQRVIFTGRRSRELLKLYYAAADALITTPWYEPFGITPLEAMACGTPVIGSDVGGLKYSIEEGKSGFLVPPHKPQVLGRRLAQFYARPELIKRMGRSALRRVNSLFTWEKVARDLAAVYYLVADREVETLDHHWWQNDATQHQQAVTPSRQGALLP
ncbi:glycosyltransferase family 1 protein [Chitiniphilus purpureus]|uniref:Glycosyltransferase family 1 protein n=1 Tax=Chitiniphilus purpureus TaxID=2981137 RepID=A0ABY6DPK6_9NEIS|nr:glycosyltransferase family 1 protein [Chitiniphilus sp. CD1]UXY16302.1 glycosyltransferase family 1 protein [Chitiniphilus sp. CD1]